MSRIVKIAAAAALAVAPSVAAAASADAAAPTARIRSCAELNRQYPNGVGRQGAVDKTTGRAKAHPVRNFTVNTRLYNSLPKTLDRDRDGIACEKYTGGVSPSTTRRTPGPVKRTPAPAATSRPKVISSPGGFAFVSPSGNVTCTAGAGDVRCDIGQFSYPLPKRPSGCDTDFGQAFGLRSKAAIECAGDTNAGSAVPGQNWFRKTGLKPVRTAMGPQAVLPYGWRINATTISCTSAPSGVTCSNSSTRHGFTVAKESYRLF